MRDDRIILEELLAAAGVAVDEKTLRAVAEWRRAWIKEWERVQVFDLRDDDLPAPLWCWPPCPPWSSPP